jgi:hypothetical protein
MPVELALDLASLALYDVILFGEGLEGGDVTGWREPVQQQIRCSMEQRRIRTQHVLSSRHTCVQHASWLHACCCYGSASAVAFTKINPG